MGIALLLSLMLAQATAPPPKTAPPAQTQPPKAPAPTQTQPPKAAPAQPAPAQPRTSTAKPPAAGTGGIAITVTDGKGMPFADVNVDLSGSVDRTGKTNAVGQISFPSLNAGTYLLRFSGEGVVTFEREVTLKPKDIVKLAITLSVAEVPKPAAAPPPPPPPPPAPVVGPTGEPQIGSLTDALRQFRNTKERREIVLSCSGNTRNMLIVLTGEQPQRRYDGAESTYYVISGQGAAIIGKIESVIGEGSFITIPRGTPYSLGRTGNRPLALLWTLSGEPCESAR